MKTMLTFRTCCFIIIFQLFPSIVLGNETIKSVIKDADYIFCIDGGGTKTELQIINRNQESVKCIYGSCSNINTIGRDGFIDLFKEMFKGTERLLGSSCALVAGLSGAGRPETKEIVTDIFEEFGISRERIAIFSDAELALENVGDGIILIAGTGSICFGTYNNKIKRAGGLGRLISDEGGGYHIGIQAIRAALEHEYGWGQCTSLTQKLRKHFKAVLLSSLIGPIHTGIIKPSDVAAVTPLVFDEWQAEDSIAQKIVCQAATDLANLLAIVAEDLNQPELCVHLVGGIFKNVHVEKFIEIMKKNDRLSKFLEHHKLNIMNVACKNVSVLATLKNL